MLAASLGEGVALATQFHAPLHVSPRLPQPDPREDPDFLLAGTWTRATAPGLAVAGAGGSWELAVRAWEKGSVHLHSDVFAFSGEVEPLSSGRRPTSGFSGTLEGDVALGGAEDSKRGYAGALVSLTVLGVGDPLNVRVAGGQLQREPDLATSVLLGVPLGATLRARLGRGWEALGSAHVVLYPGGATFFTYRFAGPAGGLGSTRRIHPHAAAGGRVAIAYSPWRLGLEAGGSVSSGSGNNEPLTMLHAGVSVRLF